MEQYEDVFQPQKRFENPYLNLPINYHPDMPVAVNNNNKRFRRCVEFISGVTVGVALTLIFEFGVIFCILHH